jgi:hypothetical protein
MANAIGIAYEENGNMVDVAHPQRYLTPRCNIKVNLNTVYQDLMRGQYH